MPLFALKLEAPDDHPLALMGMMIESKCGYDPQKLSWTRDKADARRWTNAGDAACWAESLTVACLGKSFPEDDVDLDKVKFLPVKISNAIEWVHAVPPQESAQVVPVEKEVVLHETNGRVQSKPSKKKSRRG